VVLELVQHHTPFASWGAVAYTQVDNLPLLQICALVGMAGVSFLVSWGAAALEAVWASPGKGLRQLGAAGVTTLAALAYGTLRLGLAQPGETVTVAAIGTDSTAKGFPPPPAEEMELVNQGLFARTHEAAERGAKLVGWTEVATLVPREAEPAFRTRLSRVAAENRIELVAAYLVPHEATRTYENKLVWVRPDGRIDHVYNKHHPVPGEPATPGTEAFRVVDSGVGRAAAALCYDYDFPSLARAQARLGMDLAVVPSSDWRGIDPIHTQMAAVRAIENGFSLLRVTRWGLTAAYDPYGRARAWESSFDSPQQVVLARVPRHGVSTLYTTIGEAFVVLCTAFTVLALAIPVLRPRLARLAHAPGAI
jgi:apolipoprotein N-acyltransferase